MDGPARRGPAHPRRVVLAAMDRAVRAVVDEIVPDSGPLRVLDYGCGEMPYRHLFRRGDVEYCGADLPDNRHATMEIQPDGRVAGAEAGAFDVALCLQVLEHVTSPDACLAELHRLLKPGGRLILSTHGLWVYHPHPTDYWRWTGEGLRRVVTGAGFEIHRFDGVVGLAAAAVQLFQDATARRLPGPLRGGYCLTMQGLMAAADRLSGGGTEDQAVNFLCVARRR